MLGSALKSRNVLIGDRRTSMRLEPEVWEALSDIAEREGISVHELASRVNRRRRQPNLSSAMRVFVLAYFRAHAEGRGGGMLEQALSSFEQPVAVE